MLSKSYAKLAALVFALAAAAQLWRAYTALPAMIGGNEVPVIASWFAGGMLGVLALLGFTSRG